jgi:ATP/maltotriose-dependent transcriptional regulator MalT
MQWSQQHPFAIFPGICRVHRAAVLKRRGEFAEAEAEALRAGDELRSSHRGNCAAAYVEVGDIRRRLGELDRAEEAFAQATQIAGGQCAELALLRLAQGRVSTARSVIDSCLSSAPGSRLARARLLPVAVQVAIAAGDLQAAQAAIEELEVIATTYDSAVLQATALSSRGRLQLANSDPLAATTLQQAVNSWQALHVPYEVATSQTLLGQGLRLAGDESGASAAFGSAVAIFDQVGARLEARLALGNHRGAHPAGLTDREVEVLRLIAAGRTNNEIAADLFLSTKTVSRHLSNIFTKIGVTSRAGATAYAFEHELVDRGG